MKSWDTVAIVGVGLIGGSIGLALRRRKLARRVVGIGRRQASLRQAKSVGACDATTTDLARGVVDAELVIVCTPVGQIAAHVTQATAANPAALVTDAGSTKQRIVEQLAATLPRGARFVGSHPLAGSEKRGPGEADARLLEGRTVIVTPTADSNSRDVAAVCGLWTSLGAKVQRMTPAEHDAALALVSHLPHAVAAALAAATPERVLPLAAGGWRDTTRVAAGDPELWQQIFAHNRQYLAQALAEFSSRAAALQQALERDDAAAVAKLLAEGKARRDRADKFWRPSQGRATARKNAGG